MAQLGEAQVQREVPRPKTSELLRHLLDGLHGETVTVGWLVARLGARAFGAIILLMSIPNSIPNIPGISIFFGLLIMLPAMQLTLGLRQMWLPARIANITVPAAKVASIVVLCIPWVEKFEKVVKPRLTFLTYPPMENLIGAIVILLAFVLFLPIPGSNLVPAVACAFIALGMLERDGYVILLGLAIGIAALAITGAVVAGTWHLIDEFLF